MGKNHDEQVMRGWTIQPWAVFEVLDLAKVYCVTPFLGANAARRRRKLAAS